MVVCSALLDDSSECVQAHWRQHEAVHPACCCRTAGSDARQLYQRRQARAPVPACFISFNRGPGTTMVVPNSVAAGALACRATRVKRRSVARRELFRRRDAATWQSERAMCQKCCQRGLSKSTPGRMRWPVHQSTRSSSVQHSGQPPSPSQASAPSTLITLAFTQPKLHRRRPHALNPLTAPPRIASHCLR